MKKNIGWILLISYWALAIYQAIQLNLTGWVIGFIFAPFITIPMYLFTLLITDFWFSLVDIGWLALGFYLIIKSNKD